LILAIILNTSSLHAQPGDSLTAAVARAIAEEGLVGATWSLVTPWGVTLGAAGLKDRVRNAPIGPHDRVQVGSVAKTFIATGMLRLVTEGLVALDAPVAQYLPKTRGAALDTVALGAALQWCVVLAIWGLLPLMLWR